MAKRHDNVDLATAWVIIIAATFLIYHGSIFIAQH